MPLLVVDPWDWLDKDGQFLLDNPRLYRRTLRIARFIEYGGPLQKNETLIECKRRPKGKPCIGLMWVDKTEDDGILAHCVVCKTEEALVHNWQETEWASGPMEAVPAAFDTEGRTTHRTRSRWVGAASALLALDVDNHPAVVARPPVGDLVSCAYANALRDGLRSKDEVECQGPPDQIRLGTAKVIHRSGGSWRRDSRGSWKRGFGRSWRRDSVGSGRHVGDGQSDPRERLSGDSRGLLG